MGWKKLSWVLVVLGVIAFGAGCMSRKTKVTVATNDAQLEPPSPKELRVGVAPEYPPIIFCRGGAIVGVEAEFALLLAERMGRTCHFIELKWESLISALLDGKVDIVMSGLSITDARRVRIAFAKPYLTFGQMILMRRDMMNRYPTTRDILLSDARVGVQKGTTGDEYVQRSFPNAIRLSYNTPADAAVDLTRRKLHFFIHDGPSIFWLASEHEADLAVYPAVLTKEYLAWAVRRDDSEILKASNEAIAAWKKDGTIDRVLTFWMPTMKQQGKL